MPSFLAGRPARRPGARHRGAARGPRGERHRDLRRHAGPWRCPAARDHKRLCDGDAGPNTGGMGAYSPLPDLDDDAVERVIETVHRPILAEMARRGTPFRGFLYAGLMLTADGPVLLECNVRLGDPEAQVILPRVAGSLGPLLLAAARGRLPADAPTRLPELPDAAVGDRARGEGLPGRPAPGRPDRRASTAAEAHGRARVPRRDRRAAAGRLRHQRRTRAHGRRATAATSPPPARRPRRPRTRSRGTACSAVATSPRTSRCPPEPRRDPALHAARDGRRVDRAGPLRADARGRARGLPRPGPARPRPAGGPGGDRGPGARRRRPDRRDRADHRPRRHRVRVARSRRPSAPRAATSTSA